MTRKVTFNLKSQFHGDAVPIIYGNCRELGNGDPSQGVDLVKIDDIYNHQITIEFSQHIDSNEIWYSYCFRPSYGSIIPESVPRRFLPKVISHCTIYDTIDEVTSVGDLVIHFHVRCFTNFGQHLYVVGNQDSLGNWDIESAVQLFYEGNEDFWTGNVRIPLSEKHRTIEYKYFRSFKGQNIEWEPVDNHKIELEPVTSPAILELADTFRWNDPVMESLTKSAFVDVLNKRKNQNSQTLKKFSPNDAKPGTINVRFETICPHVMSHQDLYVVGSCNELGNWKFDNGLKLNDSNFPFWFADLTMKRESMPFEYKFVVVGDELTDVEVEIEEESIPEKHESGFNDQNDGNKEQINNPKVKKTIIVKKMVRKAIWESEANRYCPGMTSTIISLDFPANIVINTWYTCPNRDMIKRFGVYVPLFSLRSSESCGIGQYSDIIGLVDFCNKIGASMIQLLPIFDTTDQGGWEDSYPYKQMSAFALHPIYINLLDVIPNTPQTIIDDINETKWDLEQKPSCDYPTIYSYKMRVLRRIFDDIISNKLESNIQFTEFLEREKEWLMPYALHCFFKDKYRTANFKKWPEYSKSISKREVVTECAKYKDKLMFTYWVQFICDKQFKKSRDYAIEHKVILKGDLPIGVNKYSVDCWAYPDNFRQHESAGAPPDDFAQNGQNWDFPTYDWTFMESDNYSWWRSRLARIASLYQAIRIDHVLGFYRIWEIPRSTCVTGMLGHYYPCNPISKIDLDVRNLKNLKRYLKPHINDHILKEKFGDDSDFIKETFLNTREVTSNTFETAQNNNNQNLHQNEQIAVKYEQVYDFNDVCNTEKKLIEYMDEVFKNHIYLADRRKSIENKLIQLMDNVLLIEDDERPGIYHVRTNVDVESIESTPNGTIVHPSTSWLELPENERKAFKKLHDYFAFERQNDLWLGKAGEKINVLKNTTNMLICAEDLGQLTDSINYHLSQTGLLNLRVQRMSKDRYHKFDETSNFNYLSVCCPSTHDCSTLRGWWEENRPVTCEYWATQLQRGDEAPLTLEPFILEMIIKQHLWSNSMFALFLLQDLTDLIPFFRRQTPQQERINDPSNPNHRWEYRYPYYLNDIITNTELTTKLREWAELSHRI
ncbi:4-alpha-glucanotransferase DPE2 [Tritrichomonas foetus]|uniref:4-alpha-glucanotransferase n=1 Tax=Tritrichomonas foetus TaxID=1144522 RepID=A0A1J4K4M7_9EUKA|nr:4-alpha-glucanotransferase DPE2 [Tritrichomonas foetus]|eukprot:OHT06147.1 4-alpha-glucanotransferase DPE2 [Tritrichomonas foetus]